jgi:general secretion pathway protein D
MGGGMMGGMGGGMGGGGYGGGGSGGYGGGGGQLFTEFFAFDEAEPSREDLAEEREIRAENLQTLIQETIAPDSWFEAGGEGSIRLYEDKKLIVRQVRDHHMEIEKLLREMRKSLGEQVSIEARFLLVGENFLEDIGLDLDLTINPGGKWDPISFDQQSSDSVSQGPTGITGSLADSLAIQVEGGYGAILDDLQAHFILRATQSHRDATDLTTGKVTVLSGESAVFRSQKTFNFALPPNIGQTDTIIGGGSGQTSSNIQQNFQRVQTGTILNVTPTISNDRKHVLLNIVTQKRGLIEFEKNEVEIPNLQSNDIITQEVRLPQTEISRVQTRVSVPDGGTLLLGGQKVTAEVERETGVPVLSKIPFLGRAFDSRSKIRDHKILLILVKPIIILEEETDADALASAESDF